MQESFGRLPDCQPAVEGEMVPLSKQRLVRSGDLASCAAPGLVFIEPYLAG